MLGRPGRGRGLVRGLRPSGPIAVGYVPAALAFGVATRQAGLGPAEAALMSLLIYSGASQFMDPVQVAALAARCGQVDMRFEPFVLAMGYSGLRSSEAINVRRRDVDIDPDHLGGGGV